MRSTALFCLFLAITLGLAPKLPASKDPSSIPRGLLSAFQSLRSIQAVLRP